MIEHRSWWPRGMYLALKRTNWQPTDDDGLGFLLAKDTASPLCLYIGTIFEMGHAEHLPKEFYGNAAALVADGWIVD